MISKFPDVFDIILGKDETSVSLPEIVRDKPLEAFLTEFVEDARKRGVIIPPQTIEKLRQIKYVDKLSIPPEPNVIAACARYFAHEKRVTGDRDIRWMIIEVLRKESESYVEDNPLRLKELLYHELFHCLLNKGHLPAGVPGIMAPTLNKYSQRLKDWDALIDEMFSPEYLRIIPDAT